MKTLMAATAVVVGLAFTAGTAMAFQCPSLIKQGRDAAAKMDANSDKVKKAASMLDKAEALHKAPSRRRTKPSGCSGSSSSFPGWGRGSSAQDDIRSEPRPHPGFPPSTPPLALASAGGALGGSCSCRLSM